MIAKKRSLPAFPRISSFNAGSASMENLPLPRYCSRKNPTRSMMRSASARLSSSKAWRLWWKASPFPYWTRLMFSIAFAKAVRSFTGYCFSRPTVKRTFTCSREIATIGTRR